MSVGISENELTEYCYKSETTDGWIEHLKKSHLSSNALSFEIYENATCVPDMGKFECFHGGVYDSELKPIVNSFQRNGIETAAMLLEKVDVSNADFIDKEVVYLGQYRNQWGSFLVDSVSRLWFALKNPKEYTFVYLATQTVLGGIHSNTWKFFEAFGIKKEQVLYIDKPTRFSKMIIPDMSYIPYGTTDKQVEYHKEYLNTIRKVVDSLAVPNIEKHDKVYFSRGKFSAKSKSEFGEEFLINLLKANGFYVVYPEEHTLEEQVYFVNTCKVFASIGGSLAHNIIFAKKPPKMILFNRMNGYQWHQWTLNEMAGVEPITYVDAYSEPYKFIYKTTISGPYYYSINKNVKKFIKDNNLTVPKYCKNLFKKTRVFIKYSFRVLYCLVSRLKRKIVK